MARIWVVVTNWHGVVDSVAAFRSEEDAETAVKQAGMDDGGTPAALMFDVAVYTTGFYKRHPLPAGFEIPESEREVRRYQQDYTLTRPKVGRE